MRTLRIKVDKKFVDFDFYKFCKYVLGYSKLVDIHKQWCEEVESSHRRKIFLKPRGTYKSTIFTIAYPLYKLIQNPKERILIANATSENAEAFLREISSQIVRNERFKSLFGELIDPRAAKISSITLKNRETYHKEPSISTIGVLGNLVSAHYSTIICDDLCNQQDRESDSVRQKKIRWYHDLLSVLDPDGEIVVIGTKWHYQDLYHYIVDELNPKLPPEEQYYVSIESCYEEDGTTSRFPTILPTEVLDRLKIEKGNLEFHSQYMNVALPQESQIFFESDFKTFTWLGGTRIKDGEKEETLSVVGYCDLSLGKSKSSDYTAIATVGKGKDGTIYLIDVSLQRVPPDKTIALIFEKHKVFDYKQFGVESNVFQSLFGDSLKKVSAEKQAMLPVVDINHHSNKALRIQSLQPIIKQGILKIRDDWRQDKDYKELLNQFIYFPMFGFDDGPDSIEGAVSLLKKHKAWEGTPFGRGSSPKININGYEDFDMAKFSIPGAQDPSSQDYRMM